MSMQQAVNLPHISLSSGTDDSRHSLTFYMGIYVAFSVVGAVVGTLKYLYVYVGSIHASRRLFTKLNFVVLRAPLRWLGK